MIWLKTMGYPLSLVNAFYMGRSASHSNELAKDTVRNGVCSDGSHKHLAVC